jgi:hypothetical protein
VRQETALLVLLSSTLIAISASDLHASTPDSIPSRLSAIHIPFVRNDGQAEREVAFILQTGRGTASVTRQGRLVYTRLAQSAGASSALDAEGGVVARVGSIEIELTRPRAYQEIGGTRRPVAVRYVVRGAEYGFRLGRYDARSPVVIDPLLQATYVGGPGFDEGNAIAVHPVSGKVYLAGGAGPGFPYAPGAGTNAFIARLNPSLTTIEEATYVGGDDGDVANALLVHPATGDIYVAGYTFSQNFAGTAGGAQPAWGQGSDGFVLRLNSDLTSLLQATYFGGGGHEVGLALIGLPSGDVYLAGSTSSSDLPGVTPGSLSTLGGSFDAFVVRFNSSLTSISRSIYLGGTQFDEATSLAINPASGGVYVARHTASNDFPGTAGSAQVATGGGKDAFVAQLPADLGSLIRGSYLGGSSDDVAVGLAVHPFSGEIYLSGLSGSSNFPGTSGGSQEVLRGDLDAFAARFNPALTSLLQATYLGGSGTDHSRGLAIHPVSGEVYVSGQTTSPDFPGSVGGAQAQFRGAADAFVSRLNSTLDTVFQSTYFGGSGLEGESGISIHPVSGDVYLAGITTSSDLPDTAGAAQTNFGGDLDGYAARFTADLGSGPQLPAAAIPTLSDWSLILLALLLAMGGLALSVSPARGA